MVDFKEIYTYSDQPATCMKCGARTFIILDLSHTKDNTQIHQCPNPTCHFEFVIQSDEIHEKELIA